jgi:hypothetical protein
MTYDSMNAEWQAVDAQSEVLEADSAHLLTELRVYLSRGTEYPRTTAMIIEVPASPEMIALSTAAAIFSKAFLETLGGRAGEGVANLPKHVRDLIRTVQRRPGDAAEFQIGAGREAAATIVVTKDTPDEARLALLDLDVTAEQYRGKTLRWDTDARAWMPEGEGSAS